MSESQIGLSPGGDRFKPVALLRKGRHKVTTLVLNRATDKEQVARLLIHPSADAEVTLLVGIAREAGLMTSMVHPSLPRFDKVVEGQGGTWMMYNFEPGIILSQYVGAEKHIPDEWLIWWLNRLLLALDALHSHNPPMPVGYFQPSDIVVRYEKLFLVDLGHFERIFPHFPPKPDFIEFVCPERRQAGEPTVAGDLFSAGAIAFWLATGFAPHISDGLSHSLMLGAIRQSRPRFPGPVAGLISQLLAFNPRIRPPSAKVAASSLSRYVKDMSGQVSPLPAGNVDFKTAAEVTRRIVNLPPPPPVITEASVRIRRSSLPPKAPIALLGVLGVGLMGGAAWFMVGRGHAPVLLGGTELPIKIVSGQLQDSSDKAVTHIVSNVALRVRNTAVLQAEHSTLYLSNGLVTLQELNGSELTLSLQQGRLSVQVGPSDRLHVKLPDNNALDLPSNSDATVDLNSHPGLVQCQRGTATLIYHGASTPLRRGDQASLSE